MRYRAYGKPALETRVDYVESRLDDTINNFKEAMQKSEARLDDTINNFKEAMRKSEARLDESISSLKEAIRDNREAMHQMENRHQANFTELRASLERSIAKAESSRRWTIGSVITVALAIIGFIITNGFQIQL